jgi:hypothetical protein
MELSKTLHVRLVCKRGKLLQLPLDCYPRNPLPAAAGPRALLYDFDGQCMTRDWSQFKLRGVVGPVEGDRKATFIEWN